MVGLLASFLAFPLMAYSPALAQDGGLEDLDDDLELPDGANTPKPQPKPAPTPTEPAPPADADDKDEGLEDFRDPDDEIDLLGEEGQPSQSGDSEQLFRSTQARLGAYDADEELAGWEEYLARYPNSAYRKRIEARMEELANAPSTIRTGSGQTTDAMREEIRFSQAMQLENIDPRTRLQAGFEWGIPNYLNLALDYEHQVARQLSFHGGVRRRYLGYSVEGGVRWAVVKSVRTNTLVTVIGDVRLNTLPAYPGLRPQLAVGKRFGKVDAQVQGGALVEYRSWNGPDGAAVNAFQTAAIGGASVYYAASEQVGVFGETALFMKPAPADVAFSGGLFQFNVVAFGMKFFPGQGEEKNTEVNFGATLPVMQQWWQFHYGSVMVQLNRYL